MYCRTCGNKMNDNAEICVKCGVKKNVGNNYCQVCGTQTTTTMTNCKKCGAKLMKSMSTAQVKKKAISKSKKFLSTILLIFGIIFLFGFVANIFVAFISDGMYYYMEHLFGAGRCAILGGLFTGLGIRFRKKQ